MTAADIETALSEPVTRPNSLYSFNELVVILDDLTTVETMVGALRAAGLNSVADSLIARGIDFGLYRSQDMLDQLGQLAPGEFPPATVAALKSLGQQSRWASLGGSGDPPDAAAIQTELDRIDGSETLGAIQVRADAAYEAAAVEYRAGNYGTITTAAESAWAVA